MKKFRFTLRSVETVRGLRELRAREAFTAAVRAVRAADAAKTQAREQRERFEVRLVAARQQPLRASEQIAFFQSYQEEFARERKAEEALVAARNEMDRQRGLWIAARRDLRVIENLKAKARETHRLACEREEQSAMDDRTNAMANHAPLLTS